VATSIPNPPAASGNLLPALRTFLSTMKTDTERNAFFHLLDPNVQWRDSTNSMTPWHDAPADLETMAHVIALSGKGTLELRIRPVRVFHRLVWVRHDRAPTIETLAEDQLPRARRVGDDEYYVAATGWVHITQNNTLIPS